MSFFRADTDPVRQAALMLHALDEADRAWMLDALSAPERETLAGLLAELHALGIPRDPGWGDLQVRSPACSELDALDATGLAALAALLEREPADVARALLAAQDWPWRARLLARLSPGLRTALQEHGSSSQGGSHLAGCVVEVLSQHVREVRQRSGAGRPRWRFWLGVRRNEVRP